MTRPLLATSQRLFSRLPRPRLFHLSSVRPSPSEPSSFTRLESRLPRFLRSYIQPLRSAPLSHITSFLILHEITAVAPLFGLVAFFHYTNWLPADFQNWSYVQQGTERFGRYLRKKGWIDEEAEREALSDVQEHNGSTSSVASELESGPEGGKEQSGNQGVRWVLEFATAYAVTKALLPLRIGLSVWATPWFARVVVLPVTRIFKSRKAARMPVAAGTGATAGGLGGTKGMPKGDKT